MIIPVYLFNVEDITFRNDPKNRTCTPYGRLIITIYRQFRIFCLVTSSHIMSYEIFEPCNVGGWLLGKSRIKIMVINIWITYW